MTLAEDNARLRAENAELRALVAQLQDQLAVALARIAALEQDRRDPQPFVKPNRPRPSDPKPPRKKRAPEHNQARRRAPPTQVEQHALERCPTCQYRLRGRSLAYRRQVLELPPPPVVQVIEHQVLKRYCPRCQCWRTPQLDLTGQVLGPRGRIGVRLAALIAYLRTTLRLPIRQLQQALLTLHQLSLSTGALVEVLHRVRQAAAPALASLEAEARASPVLHSDETGWRENGQNGYVWTLSTPTLRWFSFDRSRAGAVIRRLFGGQFDGHLVSDYYAGYNWYPGPQQRCWVHFLRDLHTLRLAHPQRLEVQRWIAAIRCLYDRARSLEPGYLTELHYALLVSEAHSLGLRYA